MKWLKRIIFDMNQYNTPINKSELSMWTLSNLISKINIGGGEKYSFLDYLDLTLKDEIPLLKYFKVIIKWESKSFILIIYEIKNGDLTILFSIKKVKEEFIVSYDSKVCDVLIEKYSIYKYFENSKLHNIIHDINKKMIEFEIYTENKYGKRIF